MIEYITDWFGIGAQLTNLYESRTPLYLWAKRIKDERRRERIVRCRDCDHRRRSWNGHEPNVIGNCFCAYTGGHEVKPDGFCAWGELRGEGGDE